MARQMNDEIKDIGLKYYGDTNTSHLIVVGSTWRIEVPMSRVGEFCRLFPQLNWEHGEFLNRIKGQYLRVTFDDRMQLYSLHHITKSIDYIVDKS